MHLWATSRFRKGWVDLTQTYFSAGEIASKGMVTESGIIHGDLSSGKSAKYNQVILVRYKICKLTDLFVAGFFLRGKKYKVI